MPLNHESNKHRTISNKREQSMAWLVLVQLQTNPTGTDYVNSLLCCIYFVRGGGMNKRPYSYSNSFCINQRVNLYFF